MVKVDVSIGELIDKATILSIKLEKIGDPEKLKYVEKEFRLLKEKMVEIGIDEQSEPFQRLREINLALWDIEDRIRMKEAEKRFDDAFIALARSVYFNNDKRADIKREINLRYGSELVEAKEYVDYRTKKG